jgi:hypothetical protein
MEKIALLILLICSNVAQSQDIKQIFINIPLDAFPSSGMQEYLKDKREYLMTKGNLIQKNSLGDDEIYIDLIDVKNGFIKFSSLRQQSYVNTHELCYWNTKDGNKLVGMNYNTCDASCGSILEFYDLRDNVYTAHKYPSPVMDKVTIDVFLDIEKSKDKLKKIKELSSENPNDIINDMFDIIYHLPQKGTSISAEISCGMDENLFVFKRKKVFLEWDGYRFNLKI